MWYQYINLYINKFFKELQNLEVLEVPEVPKAAANKIIFHKNENIEILNVPYLISKYKYISKSIFQRTSKFKGSKGSRSSKGSG